MRRVLLLILVLLVSSCDDAASLPAPPKPKPSVELVTMVSLRANQRTVIAITPNGRVFICQPDADSSVRVLEGSEPRYTALTPGRIAQALGETDATGSIRAITPLPGGELLVYYRGATRYKSLTSLLLYDPNTESIKLAVDSAKLADVSRMGRTLELADAQIIRAGTSIWVWLHHVDQSVVFPLDGRQIGPGSDVSTWRPVRSFRLDEGSITLDTGDQLFGQTDGTVWLLRPTTGDLWQLTPEGRAYSRRLAGDRPHTSVVPIELPASSTRKAQRLVFYPFEDLPADPLTTPDTQSFDATRYPAFVLSAKDTQFVLDRDAMVVRPAFPTYAMRLSTWMLDPSGDGVVAYDTMSGEILRIRFRGI